MIPLSLRLVISDHREDNSRNLNLWFPLFLLWILLLPAALLVLFVWLSIRVVAAGFPKALLPARIIEAAAKILWKLNGLRIDVRSRESRFVLHI